MYRPPPPPPCTGHRHRHVQVIAATSVYWPPPPPPFTGHRRHVMSHRRHRRVWPPPPPCMCHPATSVCRHAAAAAATASHVWTAAAVSGHHRHRHYGPPPPCHTCPFPVPRVPSPCHVSPPLPRASPRRRRRATCRCRFHVPRPAASPRHLLPNLPRRFMCYKAPRARATTRLRRLRSFVAGMPLRHRGSSGFRGVRARPNGRFYAEMRAGGFRLTLGTYNTPELAARAYDAAAWRFRRPRRDMNFPDVESLEEAEFLAPTPCLVDDEDRRRHRQVQRRIAIAEHDEELMRQWRA
ncbi:hypothetical protein QYE76_049844 [Lolium multiflorum]|uniref:AP2/ERF domain-containing protein n=1 Tax=Lolium multiflorum TaxID=4521 RepID=A0AAD8SPN8_LOLMU|nr:hypothetical protein QYE76_049844 [Lolium multiflorum]